MSTLNAAARSASAIADRISANAAFEGIMETVFAASEENKLSPFRVYVLFQQTLGADMALLPVPGSEETEVKDDGTVIRHNLWDKYKTTATNAKGAQVMVKGSFYADEFRATSPGKAIRKTLEDLATWDKDANNPYVKMTAKGDRDTLASRMRSRDALGVKMFRTAAELYYQLEAFKSIAELKVSFAKDAEGNYKFTPEPIRVIDNSDPENGSLGNVKYFSVTGFIGLDADAIKTAEDKWDAVTKPKARTTGGNAGSGNAKGNKVEPKNVDEWVNEFYGMLNYMGEPGDVGKDSFYSRLLSRLNREDADEVLLAIDKWDDIMDGIKTKFNDRVLKLKENAVKAKKAA